MPEVYGQTICQVPAPELVEGGYILPPKVVVKKMEMAEKGINYDRDSDYMLSTIDDNDVDKILIAARTTKQIIGLVSQTDFCVELYQRGYSWMMITSKTGAVIDGNKVDRETFSRHLTSGEKLRANALLSFITAFCPKVSTSTDWKQFFSAKHGLHWYQSNYWASYQIGRQV